MIKKIFIALIGFFLLIVFYFTYVLVINPKSPKGYANIVENDLELNISYSRPYKKNRLIFGEKKDSALVPYNEYWRLGANFATELSLNKPILFSEKNLKPGSYRMYAIPDSQSWEVVLNSEAGTFGFNPPDKQNDILSVIVPVQEMDESLEQFTIDFNKDTLGINLIMSWDKTRVIVPIKPN